MVLVHGVFGSLRGKGMRTPLFLAYLCVEKESLLEQYRTSCEDTLEQETWAKGTDGPSWGWKSIVTPWVVFQTKAEACVIEMRTFHLSFFLWTCSPRKQLQALIPTLSTSEAESRQTWHLFRNKDLWNQWQPLRRREKKTHSSDSGRRNQNH